MRESFVATTKSAEFNWASLHDRVVAGDGDALDRLTAVCLESIPSRLQRCFFRAPRDLTIDACVDAILEYRSRPGRFDILRGVSLIDFVYVIAKRNLMDSLSSESSRKQREKRWFVEQMRLRDNVSDAANSSDVRALMSGVLRGAVEARAAACWIDGHSADAIAAALGCGLLSLAAQRQQVRRFKARVMKRLKSTAASPNTRQEGGHSGPLKECS